MNITLRHIGKRFKREWVFSGINEKIEGPVHLGILGGNGSGKSTLLQLISGYAGPTEGEVSWRLGADTLDRESIFRHVGICAPYMQVYEDFSLSENLEFFLRFRQLIDGMDAEAFAERVGLEKQRNKPLRNFSSGMRQRVKLGLALFADVPLVLLDEPVSHLDKQGVMWFRELMRSDRNRIICVASNSHADEIASCTQFIDVTAFKPGARA